VRRFLQESHGVTSQKAPFFIITAVKTSNTTKLEEILIPEIYFILNLTTTIPDNIKAFIHNTTTQRETSVSVFR
jgi:hypothetical protein